MTAQEINQDRKIKGVLFRSLKSYIIHHFGEEEYNQILQTVGFKANNPLPSSWYPSYYYHQIINMISAKLNEPFDDVTVQVSVYSVKADLNGIYKFFMRVAGIQGVLRKMANLNNAYSNYSRMTVTENSEGLYRIQLEAPSDELDFFTCCLKGATLAMFEIFGHELDSFQVDNREDFMRDRVTYTKAICTSYYH